MRAIGLAVVLVAAAALMPAGAVEARPGQQDWRAGKAAVAPAHGREHVAPSARQRHQATPPAHGVRHVAAIARQRPHVAPPPRHPAYARPAPRGPYAALPPHRPGYAVPAPGRHHVAPPRQLRHGPAMLPPRVVAQRLANQRYRDVRIVGQGRGVYHVRARDHRGRPLMLVVDTGSGRVLNTQRLR